MRKTIQLKLTACFLIIVLFVGVVGYVVLQRVEYLQENSEHLTEIIKYAELINSMRVDVVRVTETSDLGNFTLKKDAFISRQDQQKNSSVTFNNIIGLEAYDSSAFNRNVAEFNRISEKVIEIHYELLAQDEIFYKNYPLEKNLRYSIRAHIFALNNSNFTQDVGFMQYYSKEVLYQYRDRKYLKGWLDGIDLVMRDVQSLDLPAGQKDALLAELGTYRKTAELMGNISIRQREIEEEEHVLIEHLRKITSEFDAEWTNISELMLDKNMAAFESMRKSLIAIALAAFIAAIAFGFIAARVISNPVLELKRIAEKVDEGNLSVRADIHSGDEIEDLARSFNKMVGDLKRSHEKIELHHQELENRVNERTKELNKKIDEMSDAKLAMLNMMEDAEEANNALSIAQKQLTANVKELGDANVKKNEFMSIAAHELKTPMTSIHGFAQLLQNPAIANDAEKRKKYLAIMDHETKRLANLVTDILDISRIDLNAVTFDIGAVNLREVLDAVKTEMNVQIKQKGLASEYIIDRNLPVIYTDKERVTQILMNLITNSIKYTPKGKITVRVSKEGEDIHFMIKDTGIGISKQNQSKIFTRFYQVDSSYTRSAGGVGLGLSLCKEFVGRLGGRIWFKSADRKGSEFHFTLPANGSRNLRAKNSGKNRVRFI